MSINFCRLSGVQHRLICLITLFGFVIPISCSAHAQSLGVPEMMHLLLQNNPTILSKRADVEVARQQLEIAYRQHWPTPSVGTDYGPNAAGSNSLSRVTIARLSVPIYSGGRLSAEDESATMKLRAAELDLQANGHDLGMQMLESYRNWWLYNRRIEVLQNSVRRMQNLEEMMKRRSDAGVSSLLDLQLTQVQVGRLQDELAQARQQKMQAVIDLNTMLGQSVLPDAIDLGLLPGRRWSSLDELTSQVIDTHPSAVLAQQQVQISVVEEKRTRANLLPNVSLRLERQYGTYYGSLAPGDRIYFSTQADWGAGLASLQLQQQAHSRTESAEQQLQSTRQRIQSITSRIWNEEQVADIQMKNALTLTRSYEDISDSSLRLFASGRRNWQDLMTLQREQHQVLMQRVDAEATLLGARLRMLWLADALPGVFLSEHAELSNIPVNKSIFNFNAQ